MQKVTRPLHYEKKTFSDKQLRRRQNATEIGKCVKQHIIQNNEIGVQKVFKILKLLRKLAELQKFIVKNYEKIVKCVQSEIQLLAIDTIVLVI